MAVGGCGLGGGAVAGRVAVVVGAGAVGVAEGAGSVSTGVGVSAGVGGLALAGTRVEEGNGDGLGVTLGWSVGVGRGVFVAVDRAMRVLVGVAITAGFPGAHRISSNPTRPIPTRQNQSQRRLCIGKRHILCSLSSPFKPSTLYSRTGQATSGPSSSRRRAFRLRASVPTTGLSYANGV